MGAAGLGALGGALSLALRSGVRGLGNWVATSAAAFGATLILFSVFMFGLAFVMVNRRTTKPAA